MKDPTSDSTNAAATDSSQMERAVGRKVSRPPTGGSTEPQQTDKTVAEVETATRALQEARQEQTVYEADLEGLTQAEAAAEAALDPNRDDELIRVRERVAAAEREVAATEVELARIAAGGLVVPPSEAGDGAGASAADDPLGIEAELKQLGKKELDEVRGFPKPPLPVRRSLDLVQALLAVSTDADAPAAAGATAADSSGAKKDAGSESKLLGVKRGEAGFIPWPDMQTLLQRTDFIPRLLQLKPHDLAADPALLATLMAQWPALADKPLPPAEPPGSKFARRATWTASAVPSTAPTPGERRASAATGDLSRGKAAAPSVRTGRAASLGAPPALVYSVARAGQAGAHAAIYGMYIYISHIMYT